MAPIKTEIDDFKFIMTCIKHSPEKLKPNFEEVAKEIGAKSGNACYHKHWGIMKKWGLTGSRKGPTTDSERGTPSKRRQPISADADEVVNNSSTGEEPPPKKRKRVGAGKKRTGKQEVSSVEDDDSKFVKIEDGMENESLETGEK
ncbi:hypothetical protein A1O3_08279 [Capronia epimyces CBS 606.96]|uniref:Myb-like DNA-binding domain-containing protein n=1 Tax=Capronia epimyces CBS 606.96 TaxID=1182542 RepID=W9XIG5_9EURO|nr:uncharacterized protein A1O3_08279 [Capronia epimyces CBS 606.96]EXJ79993.1 hypothetical protein A1O3_08279 [Capronia epimyces CBS 606.96]